MKLNRRKWLYEESGGDDRGLLKELRGYPLATVRLEKPNYTRLRVSEDAYGRFGTGFMLGGQPSSGVAVQVRCKAAVAAMDEFIALNIKAAKGLKSGEGVPEGINRALQAANAKMTALMTGCVHGVICRYQHVVPIGNLADKKTRTANDLVVVIHRTEVKAEGDPMQIFGAMLNIDPKAYGSDKRINIYSPFGRDSREGTGFVAYEKVYDARTEFRFKLQCIFATNFANPVNEAYLIESESGIGSRVSRAAVLTVPGEGGKMAVSAKATLLTLPQAPVAPPAQAKAPSPATQPPVKVEPAPVPPAAHTNGTVAAEKPAEKKPANKRKAAAKKAKAKAANPTEKEELPAGTH